MIVELFQKYQSGNKRTCMPNNSKPNITAATGRDAVFHTIPKPTVCYSESVILFRRLLMLVEIASRSIYMSAPTGDYYIVK